LRKNSQVFSKKFILEEEGQNKDKFDIKTRAIMPLVDGAHLLVLSSEIKRINNTYVRFKQLTITDLNMLKFI
jgi:CBS domain-containing protein